jgi:hypothetical protein
MWLCVFVCILRGGLVRIDRNFIKQKPNLACNSKGTDEPAEEGTQ